jgi:hypothetical protein
MAGRSQPGNRQSLDVPHHDSQVEIGGCAVGCRRSYVKLVYYCVYCARRNGRARIDTRALSRNLSGMMAG